MEVERRWELGKNRAEAKLHCNFSAHKGEEREGLSGM
jgi:hypothetical protein